MQSIDQKSIEAWLAERLARSLDCSPESVDRTRRFKDLGVDSAAAVSMVAELAEWSQRAISTTAAWAHPNVQTLAAHVASQTSTPTTVPDTGAQAGSVRAEPIAVIGIGCRFPEQASSPERFWQLLTTSKCSVRQVPPERWRVEEHYSDDVTAPGKMNTRWGGFLQQIDAFDAGFFAISPREAMAMDPQQRLALELAWESLEDAGLMPSTLRATRTGVYFGAMWSDYTRLASGELTQIDAHSATGQDLSIIAGRISYFFGFSGPSLVVNTACSSSLVAIHLACNALRSGEVELALVGGVNLIASPASTVAMSKFGAMSPGGRCRAFDAGADGYVRGEGGAVVVLKPLSRALRDGDSIYCVVLGSAVNNDGASNGLTAPSPQAQMAVLRDACQRAGVDPRDVDYVEAHGPGTRLGDPIEAEALGTVFGRGRAPDALPLRIGSVKTNLGHLEAAAGMAGFIKVALALKHRQLPPSLHFASPNPLIAFDALKLRVQTVLEPWPRRERALAGVSSFGFGGTNAHAILEALDTEPAYVVPVAAETPAAARLRAAELLDELVELADDEALPRVCARAVAQARSGAVRRAFVGASRAELTAALSAGLQQSLGRGEARARPRLVFVCPGQGATPWGVGRTLLVSEPSYRQALIACDDAIRQAAGFSVIELLLDPESEPLISETAYAQPTEFAIQVALGRAWQAWGLRPAAIVGHSMGEVAAAHLSGVLSLPDAARVICARSCLAQGISGRGSVAVVGLSANAAQAALGAEVCEVGVAADNGGYAVLSGELSALERVLARLEAAGTYVGRTGVRFAAHSPQVEPLVPALEQELAGLVARAPELLMISTVTGRALAQGEADAHYWGRNLRETVRFAPAVAHLLEAGDAVFVELSAHPLLHRAIGEIASACGRDVRVLASLERGERDQMVLARSQAALYELGVLRDWSRVLGVLPEALARANSADASAVDAAAATDPKEAEIFVASARSAAALQELAEGCAETCEQADARVSLRDLCSSAALTREHHAYRLAITCRSRRDLAAQLRAAAHSSTWQRRGLAAPQAKLVFVFSGLSSQWVGMGRQLLSSEPVFRREIERCERAILPHRGIPISELLEDEESPLADAAHELVQPVLFAFGVALAAQWRSWGIEPDVVIGDGAGELAAACCAGILSLEEGAYISCRRSRLVSVGSAAGESLRDGLRELRPRAASVPFFSAARGRYVEGAECGSEYWASDLHETVPFATSIERLIDDGCGTFVEVAPHPILTPAIEDISESRGSAVHCVSSVLRGQPQRAALLASLGILYCAGHEVAWSALFPGASRRARLPLYPWQRERFWPPARAAYAERGTSTGQHALLGEGVDSSVNTGLRLHQQTLSLSSLPYLADHRVQEAIVFPGAATLEMFWSAARQHCGAAPFALQDVRLERAILVGDVARKVQVAAQSDAVLGGELTLHMFAPEAGGWQSHARARFSRYDATEPAVAAAGKCWPAAAQQELDESAVYALLGRHGLKYGPNFRPIQSLVLLSEQGTAVASLRIAAGLAAPADSYAIHPVWLDGAMQVLCALAFARGDVVGTMVPVAMASYRLLLPARAEMTCRVHLIDLAADGSVRGDVRLYYGREGTSGDELVAELLGVCLRPIDGRAPRPLDDALMTLRWRPVPYARDLTPPPNWLIASRDEPQGLAAQLTAALSRSARQISSSAPDAAPLESALRGLLARPGEVEVVYLAFAGAPPASTIDDRLGASVAELLDVVRAISAQGSQEQRVQLTVLTQGAQGVQREDAVALDQTPLLGFVRSLCNERPKLRCRMIDLAAGETPAIRVMARELLADERESEIAVRGGERFAQRITRDLAPAEREPIQEPADRRSYRARCAEPGRLDRLQLELTAPQEPAAGEVVVAVEAAGLNFLDVMKALGIYPGGGPDPCLGIECSGRILKKGERVEGLALGQEVMVALQSGCLASEICVRAEYVVCKPQTLDMSQAASVPAVFMTAWHALIDVAQLAPGETVLIHSGTGGTGLAAIQVAQLRGATVIATAGSEKKRRYLQELGVRHVGDSRSLSFEKLVMDVTQNRGVDVVLNSLAGPAVDAGLRVLASDGRFLELGKKDIYAGRALPVAAFRKRTRYCAIDLAGWAQEKPAALQALLAKVAQEFEAGRLAPLPLRSFAASQLSEAFSALAGAQHVGKLVIDMRERSASARRSAHAPFRADGAYLITGGVGGLGRKLAKWVLERGAGRVVLASRRADGAVAEEALAELGSLAERASIIAADVSDRHEVERLIMRIARDVGTLRGVFHLAMVLDDGLVEQQSLDKFARVMAPKVSGAWHLHNATRSMPLDHFVLYSSIASVIGLPGQSNYAAANAFLDGLAHERRRLGLSGLSVNWGPFSEAGAAVTEATRGQRLDGRGLGSITPERSHEVLADLLCTQLSQVAVAPFDVESWGCFFPDTARSARFRELDRAGGPAGGASGDEETFGDALTAMSAERRVGAIEEIVVNEAALVLRTPAAQLDASVALQSQGLDSLLSLELINRLSARGLDVAAATLWTYPAPCTLARHLAAQFAPEPAADRATAAVPSPVQESLNASMDMLAQIRCALAQLEEVK